MHFLCKARQLGFNRLEEVQRRLQNMRCSMEGPCPTSLTPGSVASSAVLQCYRQERLATSRPGRCQLPKSRDFKLLHRLMSWAQESPTLLPSSAPAEQNPPFQEENARKMWPSRCLS